MRNIVLYMQSTFNGYGGDPDDEMFWMTVSDQTWEFLDEMQESCDAVLMGRKSYQEFLEFWPGAIEDDTPGLRRFARWQYDAEKIVISKTLNEVDPSWPNTRVVNDVAELEKVKQGPGKNLLLVGGIGIVSTLARADLIDELWIHVNPATIGAGRLLINDRLDLRLLEARPFESGVVAMHYGRRQ